MSSPLTHRSSWGSPPGEGGSGAVLSAAAAAGLGVLLVIAFLAGPWVAAGVTSAGLVTGGLLYATQTRRTLRSLGARPARHARVANLARGLARDLSRPLPELFTAPGGPNAFALPSGRGGALVVTEDLLAVSNLTELEAVVAACLVRLDSSAFRRARWTALVPPLARFRAPVLPLELDIAAARLTRYPPALADAVDKADPVGGSIGAFAFTGLPPWQLPPERRAAEIRDL